MNKIEELVPLVVPIVAMLCGTFIYLVKMRTKSYALNKKQQELLTKLSQSFDENENLSQRIKNLEYIVTSLDKDILKLHDGSLATDNPDKQIEQLKEEIKRLKG